MHILIHFLDPSFSPLGMNDCSCSSSSSTFTVLASS